MRTDVRSITQLLILIRRQKLQVLLENDEYDYELLIFD